MANPIATQTTLTNSVKTLYLKRLLMRAVARLVHGRWGERPTVRGFGSAEWRKFSALSAVTTALTEGVTPEAQTAAVTLVTATPAFYGAYLRYTDELDLTAYDPIVANFSAVLGEQAGTSIDSLIRNELTDNATDDFSNGKSTRATLDAPADDISYADFVKTIATLMGNDALPIDGNRYVAIIHPHTYATLMQDSVFLDAFQFADVRGDANPMRTGYVGTFLMTDVYISSNAREYANGGTGNDDVYSALFLGEESYGVVGIGNTTPRDVDTAGPEGRSLTGAGVSASPVDIIVKPLGSAGADDPLNQRGSVAWKASHDTQVLNSAWIIDLEHTNAFSAD